MVEWGTQYLSVPEMSCKVIGTVAELNGQYLMHFSARLYRQGLG